MGQQTQLAIGLLDLALGACRLDLFEAEDVVKGRGRASAHANDGALLVGRVCAATAAVMMLMAGFGIAVRVGRGASRFGRHGGYSRDSVLLHAALRSRMRA